MQYRGLEISEYRWRPYPSKNFEEQRAFEFNEQDIASFPSAKTREIQKTRAGYVGKLQEHRVALSGDYMMLEKILEHFEKENNAEGAKEAQRLLDQHAEKEQNINNLSRNRAFRSLAYTEVKHETAF